MESIVKEVETPLPKPARDPLGYASIRLLEALTELLLCIEFLEKGYTRNAAGKAFQAWKSLIAAILAVEKERILKLLENEDERRWFLKRGLTRVPTGRLTQLALLLEKLGYSGMLDSTNTALSLHEYQYHSPDPCGELSKYPDRKAALEATRLFARHVFKLLKNLKEMFRKVGTWSDKHDKLFEVISNMFSENS